MAVPPPYVLLPPRIGHFGTAVLLPPWSGRYLNEDAGRFLFALSVAPSSPGASAEKRISPPVAYSNHPLPPFRLFPGAGTAPAEEATLIAAPLTGETVGARLFPGELVSFREVDLSAIVRQISESHAARASWREYRL